MAKRLIKKEGSLTTKAIKIAYIIVAVIAAVIVLGFLIAKAFIRPPEVGGQVTFPVTPSVSVPPSSSLPPDSSQPPDSSAQPTPTEKIIVYDRREGVYTCLLLGVADIGGSDTIMLGCFDTKEGKASLISIPRDTLVERNGKNSKIGALYSSGGAEAVAEAVSNMLGVPVDFWLSVNLKAFRTIVNQIGGVYFTVPVDMDYDDPEQDLHIHIKKGYQKLNGEQAEGVMRCRSCYVNADIGRVQTQRAFLVALVKQTISVSNVTKVTQLINTLNKYVKSNMPLDNMIWFATSAIDMDLDKDLSSATLPGKWKSPYEEIDDEAALKLINELLPVYTEPVVMEVTNFHHRPQE